MLNKGNLHADGRALGFYLLHPGDNERVWLHSVRGFIVDIEALPSLELQRRALMDEFGAIDAIAMDATKARKPFFHHYCRIPIDEDLSPEQWEEVANRIEARLGLKDQPRAIAFHIKDGYKHMHVAYSRIDPDLKAIPMPFFVDRMMAVSRELEREWGLRVLADRREPDRPRAAKRDEFEEARRLGVSLEDARQFIRDCREHADCGRAYVAALEEGGMILARGDKRPYLVIDYAGGLHSLDKSTLGITVPNIKKWLADLDYQSLPTVEEARALQAARRQRDREQERARGGDARDPSQQHTARDRRRYQVLREEHERAIAANRITPEDYFDRDAAARAWDLGLVEAAIAHDTKVSARQARDAALPEHPRSELSHGAGEIRLAFSLSDDATSLATALEQRGYTLARVEQQDITERDRMALATLYQTQDAWMLQEGGAAKLSEPHRASAERSYEKWREKQLEIQAQSPQKKQRAPFAFPNYVDYVQGKWRDEIRRFGGYDKLAELSATEPKLTLVPRNVEAGDLVALSRHGYAYRLDRHSTGLNEEYFKQRIAGLDRAAIPTFEQATTRAFMDKTVRRMEKGRSARLHLEATTPKIADQLTGRDPGYARYRDDKLAAKHVQFDIAGARYGQEALRAVAARQMALAREDGQVFVCSPRYKFKPDPLLQEKLRDLLGEDITSLPTAQEAKRIAWKSEREVIFHRDLRASVNTALAVSDSGQAFVDALADRGYELQRDQKQMLYVAAGTYRKLLTDLLDDDEQRALIPKLEDIRVYSRLMQFENSHPRRTPEENAEYERHQARAQTVIDCLKPAASNDVSLAEALGTHAVAFAYDADKKQTYAVTERFRFELTPDQADRALQLLNQENKRSDTAAPTLTAEQLPDVKQAHGIAYRFHVDNEIKRNVSAALEAVQQSRGGGQEFAERLEAKDLQLTRDYGNRLFVDTGKRKLALHDIVRVPENVQHLQFEPEQFKALPRFRSSIDVLEAQSLRHAENNAARQARETAYVIQRAHTVSAQTIDRAVFQADRAKTMAGMGLSFVGRALGFFAGGITGLFADFGKYGQEQQPSVQRRVYPSMEAEPEPGRLRRDALARHSALEIAHDVGLRSQALANSGMVGDDKRLEMQRLAREAEERNRSRHR